MRSCVRRRAGVGRTRVAALLAAAVAAGATGARAQAIGIPVLAGGVPRGVTLQAGFGVADEGAGKGSAVMVGAQYGGRLVGIGGFVGRRMSDRGAAGDYFDVGAMASARIFGGPLVPFAVMLQAGAAYASIDAGAGYSSSVKVWHVPAGLAVSWVVPRPGVSIKPWVSPRLDWNRVSRPGTGAGVARSVSTSSDFGLSGGITFGFLSGLAIDVAYDRVFAEAARSTIGVGLGFTLP
ncbi:MAG: hypothetical protein AB7R55_04375 [Gemmatimonadales bacterium]